MSGSARRLMPGRWPCLWLLLALTAADALGSNLLEVGSRLPVLGFEDQFGQTHQVDERARVILFLPDQPASRIARKALRGQDQAVLAERGIIGIADISGLPGLFTDYLALPKIREQPWPLLLGRAEADTALFPRRPEAVTLIRLQSGEVIALEYFTDKKGLRAALNLYPQPTAERISGNAIETPTP